MSARPACTLCILREMLGVSRSTQALTSLALVLLVGGVVGCAGGEGSTSGSPFTASAGNTSPQSSSSDSGTSDPSAGTESGSASNQTNPTSGDPSGPSTDPSGTASTAPASASDPTAATTMPDPDCVDADGDLHGENCQAGPDCDDTFFNAFTMCDTCVDDDGDDFWVGCDQYGPDAQGPDCDDADPMKTNGMNCSCSETPADVAGETCAEGMPGKLGVIAEGGVVPPIKGTITKLGASDWFWVEFPEAMANGPRPNAGKIIVTFANNPGDPANPDYRFEVFKNCGDMPFTGLGAKYGMGAPPAREWDFFDAHMPPNPDPNPNPNYVNNTPWPAKVYIRVFRANNDGACSEYTLQVSRMPT